MYAGCMKSGCVYTWEYLLQATYASVPSPPKKEKIVKRRKQGVQVWKTRIPTSSYFCRNSEKGTKPIKNTQQVSPKNPRDFPSTVANFVVGGKSLLWNRIKGFNHACRNELKSPTSYQHPNHKPHYSYANTRLNRSSYYTLVCVFDVDPFNVWLLLDCNSPPNADLHS
jgi:hypothetical protein